MKASNKITFTYQASDGYVGRDRPQYIKIDLDEILEQGSVENALDFIEDYIQDDFTQKVSASYDLGRIREQVEQLFSDSPKE